MNQLQPRGKNVPSAVVDPTPLPPTWFFKASLGEFLATRQPVCMFV